MTPNDSTSKQTPQNVTVHVLTCPIFAPEVQNLCTRNGHFHSKMIFCDPAELFCVLCKKCAPKIFFEKFQGLKYFLPTSIRMDLLKLHGPIFPPNIAYILMRPTKIFVKKASYSSSSQYSSKYSCKPEKSHLPALLKCKMAFSSSK